MTEAARTRFDPAPVDAGAGVETGSFNGNLVATIFAEMPLR